MDNEFEIGDIVLSVSGHDKNRLFCVTSIDKSGKIVIIDGRYRDKSNPKTKNPKHLIKIAHDEDILNKINSKTATNAEIYKNIKAYRQIKE